MISRQALLALADFPVDGGRRQSEAFMHGQPFSLPNLRDTADALYDKRQWQGLLARDPNIPERVIKAWFAGRRLPDVGKVLADPCRRHDPYDPNMERMARKIESLGPPEAEALEANAATPEMRSGYLELSRQWNMLAEEIAQTDKPARWCRF